MTNSQPLSTNSMIRIDNTFNHNDTHVKFSDLVCIGLGISGIGLASQLRRQLKFESMHFYDRNESYSGTWWSNHYPGAACDVPGVSYSYSFSQYLGWKSWKPNFEELRQYLSSVINKYNLIQHMTFLTECQSAQWDEDRCVWTLHLKDLQTGKLFLHECRILISAIGTLDDPKIPRIPGAEAFCGEQFHSSRWNHDVSLRGKNVLVIGNGSTGIQLIPSLIPRVKTLTHIIRTPQWYIVESDPKLSWWLLRTFPSLSRLLRLYTFIKRELASPFLSLHRLGAWMRKQQEKECTTYILTHAPEKYYKILIPSYAVGCKRAVIDRNGAYIKALHADNFRLANDPIVRITENGVQTSTSFYPVDIIVYATGFQTNGALGAMKVYGTNGISLDDHWNKVGGRSAYSTIAIHGFPNFFMLNGPNSNNAYMSILFHIENSTNAVIKLIHPILKGVANRLEVKKGPYEDYTRSTQEASKKLVINPSVCNSWYISSSGWNGTVYPWSQIYYWCCCSFLKWSDWEYRYNYVSNNEVNPIVVFIFFAVFMTLRAILLV